MTHGIRVVSGKKVLSR